MVVRRLPEESELYHHGVKGQRWGIRRYLNRVRTGRRMKKLREAKAQKQNERAEREKIINSGDAKQIDKIKTKLSNEDYERALQRIRLNESLEAYKTKASQAKLEKIANRVSTVARTAGNIAEAASKGVQVYEALQKVGVVKKKTSELEKLKKMDEITRLTANIAKNNNIIANNGVTQKQKNKAEKKKLKLEYKESQEKKSKQETKADKDIAKKQAADAKEDKQVEIYKKYIDNGMMPNVKERGRSKEASQTAAAIKVFTKEHPDVGMSDFQEKYNEWLKEKKIK